MLIYYVYAYLRSSDGTPYYIGKGKGKRAFHKHGRVKIPKDRSKIVFLERNLTNVGALALESRYIQWYGRKGIDEQGVLLNIAPGGECGNRGHTRKGMANTQEQKMLNSIAAKKQWASGKGVLDQSKISHVVKSKYGVDNIRQLQVVCPHCKKEGQAIAFRRWHFDKCKSFQAAFAITARS